MKIEMKTWNTHLFVVLLIVLMFVSCSNDENQQEVKLAFTVETTVASTVNYYAGQTLQIGIADNVEPLASEIIEQDGSVVFQLDRILCEGESLWFCVPGIVKFFHVLTSSEAGEQRLVLPDKDKGSTLLTEGSDTQIGGKYYKNDWIVALYMGINKEGASDGVPIYWATGNLIATKTNAANSDSTEVSFHVATFEESCEEANSSTINYVGIDERLVDNSSDAYVALDPGEQWDLFSFGDASGVMLYFRNLNEFVVQAHQMDGSNVLYDISGNENCDIATAQLGGLWRVPTCGYSGYNVQNEYAAFEDDSEEYLNLQPDATEWFDEDGEKLGYKYEYEIEIDGKVVTINTLYWPSTGYRHSATFVSGRGLSGWYWSATADPTCTSPYVPNGTYEGEVTEKTTAFNYGFLQNELKWFPHPRTSAQAIRPICE